MSDRATTATATIAGTVALASTVAPTTFLRLFGVPASDVTGSTRFALGLFSTRNAFIAVQALRDDPAAKAAFLPLQALDQMVFGHAYVTESIPRRGAVLAATVSGAIVVLDLHRRTATP